jgi:hypothetical protein
LLGGTVFAGVVDDAEPAGSRADQHAGAEGDALGFHLRHARSIRRLVHLEVGDAVAQQAADAAVLLEHRHVVAGARQLLRGGQAGRAGADDGDLLAGLGRRLRHTQPISQPLSMMACSIDLMPTGRR